MKRLYHGVAVPYALGGRGGYAMEYSIYSERRERPSDFVYRFPDHASSKCNISVRPLNFFSTKNSTPA